MSMTKQQALEIIKSIRHLYNLDFDKPKLETWVQVLSENGDFELTQKAVKEYINSGNPYPPNLPSVMRKEPKKMEYEEVPDDIKEHRYKMANDPEYRAERQRRIDEFKKTISKFGVNNDE